MQKKSISFKETANDEARNDWKEKPLRHAIRHGNIAAADCLLAHGIDPNILIDGDTTYLQEAVCCKSIEIVKLLIRYGADLNAVDYYHSTMLHLATQNENWDIAILLITNFRADINAVDKGKKTPLDCIKDQTMKDKLISIYKQVHGYEQPAYASLPAFSLLSAPSPSSRDTKVSDEHKYEWK